MQLTIKGKNVEVTDALRDYTEKKIQEFSKYSDAIISVDVTFSTERNWHIVDIMVHTSGYVLRAEERTGDMYASIDSVVEKIEKQLKRRKEKLTDKYPKSSQNIPYTIPEGLPAGGSAFEEESDITGVGVDDEIKLVKRTNPKPMDIKDAIMDMESRGHGFYVFVNSGNGRVNVVYKVQDGYGLIDPIIS